MNGISLGETIFSVSFLSALAVVGSGVLAAIPIVAAGSALGLFRFGWQSFGDLFRKLPEREKSWGTVFDSGTLRPVPFAVVSLLGVDERILERRVADKDGRFGFLTSPESLQEKDVRIRLSVRAPGYRFPSGAGDGMAPVLYGQLYRGDILTVHEGVVVDVDVPVDPVTAGREVKTNRAPAIGTGIVTAAMADAGLWVGLLAVPLAFALDPNPFSLGILLIFLGVTSMRVFGIARHPFGTVSDKGGRAVPFALVTLHDDSGGRVAYGVSDERGRYVIGVAGGSYVLTAHTPANIVPARVVERPVTSRRGWVTQKIIL